MPEVTVSIPGPDAKARGCWYYGCFTLGMMLLVAFLSIFLGGRYFLKTFVREYTSEKPVELPRSVISTEAWDRLQARLRTFRDELDGTNGEVWLELNAEEINALVARDPAFAEFKDHLSVALEGETARCQFSYLLERLGAQKILHGRYLNGQGQLTPNLVGGKIYLTLLDIKINGKTVPDTVKPGLQAHNLAGKLNDDPKSAAVIRRLTGITIQKGKVLVAARGAGRKP